MTQKSPEIEALDMTRPGARRTPHAHRAAWCVGAVLLGVVTGQQATAVAVAPAPSATLTEADCAAPRLGTSIPREAIGEPVSAVTLTAPAWTSTSDAYCTVTGTLAPVDTSATARPITFQVVLPGTWNGRAMQLGGGGMNGVIPNLTGPIQGGPTGPARGVVTYGSDSGHQMGAGTSLDWATNDEAIKNLGFMQMKKTHDAAMVLIERAYGSRPQFNYYIGTSQGGREALTVAQRYPADYHGIVANVPIVSFSSLMLGPELIRIHEKPLANFVTRAKVAAIRAEFLRQCDGLDGLVDGILNHYAGCRAIFDVRQGARNRSPWAAKRCPDNVDPDPADVSPAACLNDGQISTLQLVYSRYPFATPLAHGVRTFGMWV
ncbi:MAG: tannase/feruloyl esterase family alpha/beta hydrolase, partial [Vicinamibacterales bacterium]